MIGGSSPHASGLRWCRPTPQLRETGSPVRPALYISPSIAPVPLAVIGSGGSLIGRHGPTAAANAISARHRRYTAPHNEALSRPICRTAGEMRAAEIGAIRSIEPPTSGAGGTERRPGLTAGRTETGHR